MKVVCDNCGEVTEKRPCRIERSEYDFCSRECSDNFQKQQFSGSNNPNYRGGGVYECIYCGDVNETTPSKAKTAKYCDSDCMAEDYQSRHSGEGNPMWNGGLDKITCEWCGGTAEFVPAEAEVRRFCCDRCYKNWLSEQRKGQAWTGEDNPAWSGGQERHRFYGRNWEKQREAALQRDDHECLMCGSGEDLNVHHKVPIRNFDRDEARWYERANSLDNLITLCRSCHMTVHGNSEEHLGEFIG